MMFIKFKRGDTFRFTAQLQDESGNPVNIENIDIKVDIRHGKDPVRKFSVGNGITKINPENGEFEVLDNETYNYPLKQSKFDIQYTIGNEVVSTETIILDVEEDMTR